MTRLSLNSEQSPISPWIFSIPGEKNCIPQQALKLKDGMEHTKVRNHPLAITYIKSPTHPGKARNLPELEESPLLDRK